MLRLRLRLIDALMRAEEATAEALAIAIELAAAGDDAEPTASRGAGIPFKSESPATRDSRRPTTYTHVAISQEKILAHLRAAHAEASTETDRQEVVDRMKRLVEQGVILDADIAEYVSG